MRRGDIEAFLRRLAFLAAEGRISTDARTRICREVRHVLTRMRTLGLTRHGGPVARLGEDFTLAVGDVPIKPEDPEPNRDLPGEIMRQLCAQLPILERVISCREIRLAVELLIGTGRRPGEICALGWDCLDYDEDRSPVLVYDNHKNVRLGRRLPISQATAESQPRGTPGLGPTVSRASPQADLAAAQHRYARMATRIQQLETRLSELLGAHAWRESGLGASSDIDQLNQQIVSLEQHVADLRLQLQERDQDLAADRELMASINVTNPNR